MLDWLLPFTWFLMKCCRLAQRVASGLTALPLVLLVVWRKVRHAKLPLKVSLLHCCHKGLACCWPLSICWAAAQSKEDVPCAFPPPAMCVCDDNPCVAAAHHAYFVWRCLLVHFGPCCLQAWLVPLTVGALLRRLGGDTAEKASAWLARASGYLQHRVAAGCRHQAYLRPHQCRHSVGCCHGSVCGGIWGGHASWLGVVTFGVEATVLAAGTCAATKGTPFAREGQFVVTVFSFSHLNSFSLGGGIINAQGYSRHPSHWCGCWPDGCSNLL